MAARVTAGDGSPDVNVVLLSLSDGCVKDECVRKEHLMWFC
jgi:hypothetical protein